MFTGADFSFPHNFLTKKVFNLLFLAKYQKFNWPLEKKSFANFFVSDVTMVDYLVEGEIEEISPSEEKATFSYDMPIKLIDIDAVVLTVIQERLFIMIHTVW